MKIFECKVDKNMMIKSNVKRQENNFFKLLILLTFSLSLITFGLIMDTPQSIIIGLQKIIFSRDTLISDYIKIGGIGASFVNSGLLTLAFIL